jgi:hypothetical protein
MKERVVTAAIDGTVVRCGDISLEGPATTDDSARLIEAQLLRELLIGKHGTLDPRGVRIWGARITGPFDLNYVRASVGLELVNCVIDEIVELEDARLPRLRLTGSSVRRVDGEGLQVEGSVFLDGGFIATSLGGEPTVLLEGAHIGGNLSMRRAQLTNENGVALSGDGLTVDGSLLLDQATATGHNANGAIRLTEAKVGGQLSVIDAQVTNRNGPALVAHGLKVDGDAFFEGLKAVGNDEYGAVRLSGVQVGNQLNLAGARIADSPDLILSLTFSRIGRLYLTTEVICPMGERTMRKCSHAQRQIDLGEVTYTSLAHADLRQWLHLLRWHTKHYLPTPYQQLAAAYKATGHDYDARRILIAQQNDLHERGNVGGSGAPIGPLALG